MTWSIVTGRDAAPVVDAGIEQAREVVVGEVRRRLHGDVVGEQQPRSRDRPEVLVEARLRVRGHPRPRLGAEVLDDHLLQVAVPLVHRRERPQRLDPLGARLADPDQDPARERDPQLAGELDRLQPARRQLVGRGPVRAALRGQALRDVSSMIPIEAETGRSAASSSLLITPGFRCGSSPVSSSTSLAHRARYSSVVSQPSAPVRGGRPCSGAPACRRA